MKSGRKMRRVFAGILALILLVASMPSVAYAVEGENEAGIAAIQEAAVSEEAEQDAIVSEEEEKEPGQDETVSEEKEREPGQDETASEEKKTEQDEAVSGESEEPAQEEGSSEETETGAEPEQDAELPKEGVDAAEEDKPEWPDAAEEMIEVPDKTETNTEEASVYASQDLTEYPVTKGNIYMDSNGYIAKCDKFVTEATIPEFIGGKKVIGISDTAFSGCNELRKVTVTGKLSSLGGFAFQRCISLEEIHFMQGVDKIGEYAFFACKGLETVTFSGKTDAIGDKTFQGCTGLRKITLPEGLSSTGNYVFEGCTNLQSVVIPPGVTIVGRECFSQCSSLSEINLPESVTTIVRGAFIGCTSLSQITFPQNVTEVGLEAFLRCSGLQKVTVIGRLSSIGEYAFYSCKSLEEINFMQGIAKIGNNAFEGCISLETVIFSGKTDAMGKYAFKNCPRLKKITLPEGLSSTGYGVFEECSNLQSVIIPSGVTIIERDCFNKCISLPEISFPESITTIDTQAFQGCTNLSQITLPPNVTEVGQDAFYNCSGLKKVTVIGRLSSIKKNAFENCKSLEEINFAQGVASIGEGAFKNCKSLAVIYMFDKITLVGPDAFYNCNSLSDVYYYGTEQEWQNVQINAKGNDALLNATIHYNYGGGSQESFYTVTFDMQGHGTSIEPYSNISSGTTFRLPEPFEEGYLFDGWYTQQKGGGEKAVSPFTVTQDITLYANWIGSQQPTSYTVTFDMQGHGTPIDPHSNISPGTAVDLPEPFEAGYLFDGWYTQEKGKGEKAVSPFTVTQDITLYANWIAETDKDDTDIDDTDKDDTDKDTLGGVLPGDIPADGKIPEGLWIADIADTVYNGMPVQPDVHVYDHNVRLRAGADYTISYKNNLNAAKSTGQNAPTVIVNGKGNYSGKETAAFTILQIDISGMDVYAENVQIKIGGKAQKPVPILYYMGTKLVNNKDFTVSYANTSGVYAGAGTYNATVTGKGNFYGTRDVIFTAVDKVVKQKPENIAKAKLTGFQTVFDYTGQPCTQQCTLTMKMSDGSERRLTEGTDYTVVYANNEKAGKGTVTYCGKNGFTGKLKKTYRIQPYHIQEDAKGKISYDALGTCVYAKGGSKPKPVLSFGGVRMKEGVDYTLSYKNNKTVGGGKIPAVVVNGKGSFKGKLEIPFQIKPQDLSKMMLVSGDQVYKNKAGIYKITPKLMDLDGKMLSAGTDFDKNSIVYTYEENVSLENNVSRMKGESVEETDIIPANTQIRITLNKGSGNNYSGSFSGVYKIVKASIASAKVTIPRQIYTGKEIRPDSSQIIVKVSGKVLRAEDYEIVGYNNNINKGKATVIIKGRGDYGGMKTVSFTIGAKGILWWRR